jgi:nitrite reductase (NADH) small subunit
MSNWIAVGHLTDLPAQGARVVEHNGQRIALFRTNGDAVHALIDRCPHKGGQLSQGMVCGNRVTCPMHNWSIELASGQAVAPDVGQAQTVPVKVDEAGAIYIGSA